MVTGVHVANKHPLGIEVIRIVVPHVLSNDMLLIILYPISKALHVLCLKVLDANF